MQKIKEEITYFWQENLTWLDITKTFYIVSDTITYYKNILKENSAKISPFPAYSEL